MTESDALTCFFIAPIGHPNSDVRSESNKVLRYIVCKAVEPLRYKVERADEIGKPGMITDQVLDRVVNSSLVVADLTGHNPNVFYELSLRHALRKPFVQIIRIGENMPFDVANTRTIHYDVYDPDMTQAAIDEITKQVRHLEHDPTDLQTPISVSLGLQELKSIADPVSGILSEIFTRVEGIHRATGRNQRLVGHISQALGVDPKGVAEPLPPALYREVRRNGDDIVALTEEIRALRREMGSDHSVDNNNYERRRYDGGYGPSSGGDPMDVDDLPF